MTHVHQIDDQGLCACGFDASPGPHVVEVKTSTPEEFATYVSEFLGVFGDFGPIIEATRFRDAALLAPLRAENALLRAEATAHMGVARAAEAEVARLREALRPFATKCLPIVGNGPIHVCPDSDDVWIDSSGGSRGKNVLTVGDFRAAARALAEGQP